MERRAGNRNNNVAKRPSSADLRVLQYSSRHKYNCQKKKLCETLVSTINYYIKQSKNSVVYSLLNSKITFSLIASTSPLFLSPLVSK